MTYDLLTGKDFFRDLEKCKIENISTNYNKFVSTTVELCEK